MLEKGFTDQIRKEEAEQNKNKARIPEPVVDREVDKEINPIFYKKTQQAEEPRHIEKTSSAKVEEAISKPISMNIENPVVKEKPAPKPTVQPLPTVSPPAKHNNVSPTETKKQDPVEVGISLSHKEWKDIESTLKKSIDENTDIESKALSLKVLKLLQQK